MGQRKINIIPDPGLVTKLRANLTPPEAIGELVANCFDARINEEKLNISIDLRNDCIVVKDNGKGMPFNILEKALCIAVDMSKYIDRREDAKGHFGMGFKTACATLGDIYEIYTRPIGEDVEYHVEFDLVEFSRGNTWEAIIEDSKPSKTSPLKEAAYGTAFVIKRLYNSDSPVSAVLEYMGEAFKYHIEKEDKITVIDENGEYQAKPKSYAFLEGTKVKIDETFGPNDKCPDKYHVTGWVAIDSQTHNNGFYGFNIYRKGQLILTHDKSWISAHLMTSRIIGEVHMDFLDSTFYKQGVQRNDDWKIVQKHMREYLKGVQTASRELSRNGNINKPTEKKTIIKKLNNDYSIENDVTGNNDVAVENDVVVTSNDSPERLSNVEDKPTHTINDIVKEMVTEKSLVLEGNGEIKIRFVEKKEDGHGVGPYDYIFDPTETPMELLVLVYENHSLWRKPIDNEVREIIAISDAIYRALVVELGVDSRKALKIRNEWVSQRIESKK